MSTFLITGGAGFIGSHLAKSLIAKGLCVCVVDIAQEDWNSANFDELAALGAVCVREDINCATGIQKILDTFNPAGVYHLAAVSHVDHSIKNPASCLYNNVQGTKVLLEEVTRYWYKNDKFPEFRLLYCSTDEVYGSCSLDLEDVFVETRPIKPSNVYAASKAAAEHLCTAWHNTYKLPIVVTRSSNNYGPHQGLDKFVPLTIGSCIKRTPIQIHGDGSNIRNWIYVKDCVAAIIAAFNDGKEGEIYNIGGGADTEYTNLTMALHICDVYDRLKSGNAGDGDDPSRHLIQFVADRLGNDLRYSVDTTRIFELSKWLPQTSMATGLATTVEWYINNPIYHTL